jgi:hypothetical protein
LDETSFDADAHIDYVSEVLGEYDLSVENIAFLVGANCNTNNAIADKLRRPIIGCASHRLNLAVKAFYQRHEQILEIILEIMKKLRNLKNSGKLRQRTSLRPKIRNVTRWSSTYTMIDRFIKLLEFDIATIDPEIAAMMPTRQDLQEITQLHQNLKNFQSCTMKLQESHIDLLDVRLLFDGLIADWRMESALGPNARIVHSANFERAILKVLETQTQGLPDPTLLPADIASLKLFKKPAVETSTPPAEAAADTISYADQLLQANKKRKTSTSSNYVSLKWIPPTSNLVERLFSRMKLVFSERRQNMNPSTLEMVLMLLCNKELWSVKDINDIYMEKSTPLMDDEDDEDVESDDDEGGVDCNGEVDVVQYQNDSN